MNGARGSEWGRLKQIGQDLGGNWEGGKDSDGNEEELEEGEEEEEEEVQEEYTVRDRL